MQNQKISGGILSFDLMNESAHIANSLRRVFLEDVPTLAIDIVAITQNTSAIMDEILTQRLGLLPIKSDLINDFVLPEKCSCETGLCSRCAVILELDVKSTREPVWITEHDFKTNNKNVYPVIYPERESLRITLLKRDQHVKLRAVIRKGTGSQHVKWSPVITPTMNYENNDVDEEGQYKMIKMSFASVGQLPLEDILIDGLSILRERRIRLAYTLNT